MLPSKPIPVRIQRMTNPMPPQDIDHIIRLIEQIADAAQAQHVQSTIQPLQKQLKLYLAPRWDLIWPYTTQAYNNPFYKQQRRAYGNVKYDLQQDIEKFFIEKNLNWRRCATAIAERSKKVVEELECVKAKLEYNQKQFPATTHTEPNTTPAKPERESWYWKPYEKTLKVIVDVVLERLWPE